MNIDYLKSTLPKRQLVSLLDKYDMAQVITHPTRVAGHSASLIDHIYVNNYDRYHLQGVVDPGLSDHCLIFVTRKHFRPNKEKEVIFVRDHRNFDEHAFSCDLSNAYWSDVFDASNVDKAVATFNFIFLKCVNTHLPWCRIRSRRDRAPWVTSEYLSLIDTREYWARGYRKNPIFEILLKKQMAVRACNTMRRELKQNFVEQSLSKHQHNPRKLWNAIHNFWPAAKSKNNFSGLGNGTNNEKADLLNDHFVSIAHKLSADLPEPD